MSEVKDTNFQDFQSPHEASVERLIQSLDRAYHRPGLLMWRAFLQGLMTAIGVTVGYALILIALAYLIQVRGGINKLIDPLLTEIQQKVVPASLQAPASTSGLNLTPEQIDEYQKLLAK